MAPGPNVRVVVEMEKGSEPIEGTVEAADAPPRPFMGWIDLVATLDEAREASAREESPDAGFARGSETEEGSTDAGGLGRGHRPAPRLIRGGESSS